MGKVTRIDKVNGDYIFVEVEKDKLGKNGIEEFQQFVFVGVRIKVYGRHIWNVAHSCGVFHTFVSTSPIELLESLDYVRGSRNITRVLRRTLKSRLYYLQSTENLANASREEISKLRASIEELNESISNINYD